MNEKVRLLITDSIEMRDISESDAQCVYGMYQNKSQLHLWSPNTEFDGFEKFKEMLNRRLAHRWDHGSVFIDKKTEKVIGFAYCYNANEFNNNACVCLYVDRPYIGQTYALQASYMYLNNLFIAFKYRKLYAEVYSYNSRCVRLLRRIGFSEEGCLREHQSWDGKYWDQLIFSITSEMFEVKRKHYKRLLERVFK